MKLPASVQQSFLICAMCVMVVIQTAGIKQTQRPCEGEGGKSEQMIREGMIKGGNKLLRLIGNHKEIEKHENGEYTSGFGKEMHS